MMFVSVYSYLSTNNQQGRSMEEHEVQCPNCGVIHNYEALKEYDNPIGRHNYTCTSCSVEFEILVSLKYHFESFKKESPCT
jgi:DNA-directed RNA polymerase subunit RPC12/RpoP